jgi:hypothetical protein
LRINREIVSRKRVIQEQPEGGAKTVGKRWATLRE